MPCSQAVLPSRPGTALCGKLWIRPIDYTFTPEEGGVHTFTITLQTSGPQTVQATDAGNAFHTGAATVLVDASAGPAYARPMVLVSGASSSVDARGTTARWESGPPFHARPTNAGGAACWLFNVNLAWMDQPS